MESTARSPRRTEGKRTHGRSARVMESVLEAAAEELGRVGFSRLRIEDVASRSGVNKTSIYRRWRTKVELIASVVEHQSLPVEDVDTGSLASDIHETLVRTRARLYSIRHRGVMSILLGERADPEVAQLVRDTRAKHVATRQRIFERAVERGEIAACDAATLVEFLTAPLISRIMHAGLEVDDAYIDLLARVLTAGIISQHAIAGSSPPAPGTAEKAANKSTPPVTIDDCGDERLPPARASR